MSSEAESVSPESPGGRPTGPSGSGGQHERPRVLRGPRGWGWAVPVVAALAGGLFAASALTAHGTDLRGERRTDLTDLVRSAEHEARAADARVIELQDAVTDLAATAAGSDSDAQARADARVAALAAPAGLTAVRGPGLVVTLDDAPRGAAGTLPDGITPDDLVVHQEDVRAVVNALWAGGAEAMQLMDQRIVATSAVRCVGNTLVLQGRVYSPPFRIAAIGDTTRLEEALDASPGVSTYRQFVDVVGLGYRAEPRKEITVPAYQGSLPVAGVPERSGEDAE